MRLLCFELQYGQRRPTADAGRAPADHTVEGGEHPIVALGVRESEQFLGRR